MNFWNEIKSVSKPHYFHASKQVYMIFPSAQFLKSQFKNIGQVTYCLQTFSKSAQIVQAWPILSGLFKSN